MSDPRQGQIELLRSFLDPVAFPPALGVHGPPSTGKTTTLKRVLEETDPNHIWVRVDGCLTPRLLYQKALSQLASLTGIFFDGSCETPQYMFETMDRMLTESGYKGRIVVVLDRMDTLEGASTVFSAFSRPCGLLKNPQLMVIFVYQCPEPKSLLANPVPHVFFPRYTEQELISILVNRGPAGGGPGESNGVPNGVPQGVPPYYSEFVAVCVTTFIPYADANVDRLYRLCTKLWPKFIEGEPSPHFAAQLKARSGLFHQEETKSLPAAESAAFDETSCYMLCAAFLASHNEDRYDFKFFSRAKDVRGKRRQTAPRHQSEVPETCKPSKVFELERLLAIYHAMLPDSDAFIATTRTSSCLASLCSKNFILRSTANDKSKGGDPLDTRTRWSSNVSYEFIREIAQKVDLDLQSYMSGFD